MQTIRDSSKTVPFYWGGVCELRLSGDKSWWRPFVVAARDSLLSGSESEESAPAHTYPSLPSVR